MRKNWIDSLKLSVVLLLFTATMLSCRGHQSPKPRGYFRIEFPEHSYQQFDTTFPYKFEYPKYSKIVMDTLPGAEAYWCNIAFPIIKRSNSFKLQNHWRSVLRTIGRQP